MEVTGGALAVVSLSIQLIQSIMIIKTFIRGVQQAPTEAHRIFQTLDSFCAILEDVHDIVELQTSRFGQHVPLPSATILTSLQRCEEHLRHLDELLKQHSSSSQRERLWSNTQLVSATKDILELENRIQQEIPKLNTALTINFTRIQLHMHHLSNDGHAEVPKVADYPPGLHQRIKAEEPSREYMTDSSRYNSRSGYVQRTTQLPSLLQRFGVRKHMTQCMHQDGDDTHSSKKIGRGFVVWEEYTYSWHSSLWSYGVQCSRRTPYGSILPALRVYPVVRRIPSELFITGSVEDFKIAFSTGHLHPFMREDGEGFTMLSLAAFYCRVDICIFLREFGVLASDGPVRFQGTFLTDDNRGIDTLRLFLTNTGYNDLSAFIELLDDCDAVLDSSVGVADWLWTKAPTYFTKSDAAIMRKLIVRGHVIGLPFSTDRPGVRQFLLKALTGKRVFQDTTLVDEIFWDQYVQVESFTVGKFWIVLFLELGVDMAAYSVKQLAIYHDGLADNRSPRERVARRSLIIEYTSWGQWILGWEWKNDPHTSGGVFPSDFSAMAGDTAPNPLWLNWQYDPHAPGSLVLSEFSTMAAGTTANPLWLNWPYYEYNFNGSLEDRMRGTPVWSKRLQRKFDKKSRKERKALRQKTPKENMPGSWIH